MKLSDVGLLALWLVAAAVVVAGAYALAHVTTMTQSMRARAVIKPVIDTSQLKVSVAAHYTDLHTGYVIAPMSFTNSACTCELFSDTPVVQAASGPQRTPVGVATSKGDLIGPGVLLKDGQSSLSMLDLAPVKPAWAPKCRPVATDGLVISDGLPTGSIVYVHYVLARVCASSTYVNIDAGLFTAPTA